MINHQNEINQNNSKVIILMATYNGSKYITEQVESIINQTYKNWLLLIRDDSSIDGTLNIIENYAKSLNKIKLISDGNSEKGALLNFAALYLWAKNNLNPEYIMFSDQDDIWKPDKIENAVDFMQKTERKCHNMPLLVYSDLELISENGKALNTKINVLEEVTFNEIIAQNYCFGCTMLLNRSLIEVVDTISSEAENHDYWIALAATAFGNALYLDKPGILYRQHNNNVTSQGNTIKKRFQRYTTGLDKKVKSHQSTLLMLEAFYNKYKTKLDYSKKTMLSSYLQSYNKGVFSVFSNLIRYKIFRLNYLQNIAFAFIIIKYCSIKYPKKNS